MDENATMKNKNVYTIRPKSYVIEGADLLEWLKDGTLQRICEKLREKFNATPVMLMLDPIGHPGLIMIGHESRDDIEKRKIIVSADPTILEEVIKAIKEVLQLLNK